MKMNIERRIKEILENNLLDSEEIEASKCRLIEELITDENWTDVEKIVYSVLEDSSERYTNWHTCAEIIWGAVLDKRPLEDNKAIALVYHRLKPDEYSNESNLAWSIASSIKGVGYLSDYDPLKDPEIIKETNKLIKK